MIRYLNGLDRTRTVLWCYLLWYLVTVAHRFDGDLSLWLNSLGISVLIGIALLLSLSNPATPRPTNWQVFRLFLVPFCVSSFSSLIKGHDYFLVIPSEPQALAWSVGVCSVFILCLVILRVARASSPAGLDP